MRLEILRPGVGNAEVGWDDFKSSLIFIFEVQSRIIAFYDAPRRGQVYTEMAPELKESSLPHSLRSSRQRVC
ncbi:hypothetical protein CKO22_07195 [Thiococcus pfennigii]|nr:hypothetical protein [Thiococcus pfennigii]